MCPSVCINGRELVSHMVCEKYAFVLVVMGEMMSKLSKNPSEKATRWALCSTMCFYMSMIYQHARHMLKESRII